MQRKQGGLVPFAATLADLHGPVQAPREVPARSGFTRVDQVNQLVAACETNPERSFMARMMALCSLLRTNPGNRLRYVQLNGPYKLGMTAGIDDKLPFRNYPRLLLAYVSTEAVKTQSWVLILGDSLAKFMRTLGVYSSGGGNAHTKLRNQMRRLFGCTVSLIYEDEHGEQFVSTLIAERGEFWWNERKPDQPVLWESKIYLGEALFNEIIRNPVPLDTNILTALKRCALGLDLRLSLALEGCKPN